MSIDMKPLVDMCANIVDHTCARFGVQPTPAEKVEMTLKTLVEWMTKHNAQQMAVQDVSQDVNDLLASWKPQGAKL